MTECKHEFVSDSGLGGGHAVGSQPFHQHGTCRICGKRLIKTASGRVHVDDQADEDD